MHCLSPVVVTRGMALMSGYCLPRDPEDKEGNILVASGQLSDYNSKEVV